MSTATLTTFNFHQDKITLIDRDGTYYVAMKAIVERLGMSWKAAHRKLLDPRWGIYLMVDGSADHGQEIACLPIRKFLGWLYSVSPSRVKPEARPALELYQAEMEGAMEAHILRIDRPAEQRRKAMEAWVLIQKRRWATIKNLIEAGHPLDEVASTMKVSRVKIRVEALQMFDYGILDTLELRALATERDLLIQRMRLDATQRKPLRGRVVQAVDWGWDFETLWRSGSASRPRLVETIKDCLMLGLIEAAPEGGDG